ncbi:hypothetical protein TRVL_05634 [Trypanosoma vivax]|nr:hypothetical protein TRVL_05634 [Trypanosoma vivax]
MGERRIQTGECADGRSREAERQQGTLREQRAERRHKPEKNREFLGQALVTNLRGTFGMFKEKVNPRGTSGCASERRQQKEEIATGNELSCATDAGAEGWWRPLEFPGRRKRSNRAQSCNK